MADDIETAATLRVGTDWHSHTLIAERPNADQVDQPRRTGTAASGQQLRLGGL